MSGACVCMALCITVRHLFAHRSPNTLGACIVDCEQTVVDQRFYVMCCAQVACQEWDTCMATLGVDDETFFLHVKTSTVPNQADDGKAR